MQRLAFEKRAQIIAALVEGNSIRAICRMTGAAKGTVIKLLVDLGTACSVRMDQELRDLPCERLQVDEIWTFVGAKQKNVPIERQGDKDIGDVWTWVAIDADTKLVPSYRVGARDLQEARLFMATSQAGCATESSSPPTGPAPTSTRSRTLSPAGSTTRSSSSSTGATRT